MSSSAKDENNDVPLSAAESAPVFEKDEAVRK